MNNQTCPFFCNNHEALLSWIKFWTNTFIEVEVRFEIVEYLTIVTLHGVSGNKMNARTHTASYNTLAR